MTTKIVKTKLLKMFQCLFKSNISGRLFQSGICKKKVLSPQPLSLDLKMDNLYSQLTSCIYFFCFSNIEYNINDWLDGHICWGCRLKTEYLGKADANL